MTKHILPHSVVLLVLLLAFALFIGGCGSNSPSLGEPDEGKVLAGTWTLKSKIVGGQERPIDERFMKMVLRQDGTFQAFYRGNSTQNWIRAGAGAFSYRPPLLKFFWDTGQQMKLLVTDKEPDLMRLHHGLNMVPLKDQPPDEVFVRTKPAKGPASSSS